MQVKQSPGIAHCKKNIPPWDHSACLNPEASKCLPSPSFKELCGKKGEKGVLSSKSRSKNKPVHGRIRMKAWSIEVVVGQGAERQLQPSSRKA